MMLENISINLQQIVEKINNAISDVDYASSYSRSSASSSYCSYAKSSLRGVVNDLTSLESNQNNLVEVLKKCTNKINNAISDID